MTIEDHRTAAVALMRDALAHLDDAGEGLAACRLQHAIDDAEHEPPATEASIAHALETWAWDR